MVISFSSVEGHQHWVHSEGWGVAVVQLVGLNIDAHYAVCQLLSSR